MNILPKKKWHVRTKENVARVRRDQKLAAEEEQRIRERAQLAEQQFKVNLLRKHADERMLTLCGTKREEVESGEGSVQLEGCSGHVNLFAELEEEDRKNLGTGNKEYEEEKRKEREEYESKIGILKYLGEGSNDFTKQKSWYEQVPSKRAGDICKKTKSITRNLPTGVMDLNKERKFSKKERKRKRSEKKPKKKNSSSEDEKDGRNHRMSSIHRKRKRFYSRSAGISDGHTSRDLQQDDKEEQLQKLRIERIQREKAEKKKVFDLLNPVHAEDKNERTKPKYSSQFNPELAKQNFFR
ncbi:Leukocyte receptor cluster member 1 -like protein [Toxocara canis]|uniref:Leukocyte receptor cluster member 1-like protein n=2 Tax=Toxocara canis TaxID=6265 RepID=A0A0B2V8L9_TOXCA|nr:Leukocyte receptor cluster member 1 -like protein [Toxocara canis]VDM38743.1 unnamed protein product [Toxocara canis]